jgi:predicted amidohydrolase
MYVIAAAEVGRNHEKRNRNGNSVVVDPFGKVVLDLGQERNAIGSAEISQHVIDCIERMQSATYSYFYIF